MAINQIIGEVGGGISIVLGLIAILYGILTARRCSRELRNSIVFFILALFLLIFHQTYFTINSFTIIESAESIVNSTNVISSDLFYSIIHTLIILLILIAFMSMKKMIDKIDNDSTGLKKKK
ncbi:hypothetical protein J4205_04305 [Candidatus Pacearchaeota archaeon]|nr:hypothetical protein [Candidatus Pacearchaeota archaeon]